MATIPKEVKKRCIEMALSGLNSRQIYDQYYSKSHTTAYEGFRSMLKKWKRKYRADEKYLEETNYNFNYDAERITVQRDSKGDITQTWIKYKENQDHLQEIKDLIKNLKPFEKIEITNKEYKNKMLEINLVDLHFGVMFFDDYKQDLIEIISLIEKEPREEINIVMGEDLLHNNDFKGHTANLTKIEQVDMPRAYKDAVRFYSEIIEYSLKNSSRVNVIFSPGNHDTSLSWTLVQVLKALYPQCSYNDDSNPRKIIKFHKIFIGVSHMDKGPRNLKDIKELFVEENLLDYANASVKEIHLGHLHRDSHTGDYNGCIVRRLSTKVKTDKWHHEMGYTMAVKRFQLFEYSHDKLLAIYYI